LTKQVYNDKIILINVQSGGGMGVVHKLNPEVREFIIEQKKLKPSLSCRVFTALIEEKLKIKVSKSSINAIFQEAGLSMPVGRRAIHKKRKTESLADRVKLALQGPANEKEPVLIPSAEQESQLSAEEKILKEIQQEKDRLAREESQRAEEEQEKAQEQLRKAQEEEAVREEARRKEEERLIAEKATEEERLSTAKAAEEARLREVELKEEQEKWARKAEEERKIAEEAVCKAQEEEEVAREEARRKEEERLIAEKAAEEERLREAKLREEKEESARKAEQESQLSAEEKILKEIQQEKDRLAREESQRAEEEQEKAQEQLRKAQEEEAAREEARRKEEERLIAEKAAEEERLSAAKAAEEARRQEEKKIIQEPPVIQEPPAIKEKNPLFADEDKFAPVDILPQSRPSSGAILLKALDSLIGGSIQINEIICKKINRIPEQTLALTQALIFESLFENDSNLSGLWSLIGVQYSWEILQDYSGQFKQFEAVKSDILRAVAEIFTEARGVKINFPDGEIVYLDGQLHTVWSTAYAPSGFSDTVYSLKNYLSRYFFGAEPVVLFSAPGYDIPPKEFFTLLTNFNNARKAPDVLTLYGNKLEDLENISLQQRKSYPVIFCLWPWQYTSHRKISKLGDFKPYYIEGVNREFYLAEMEMNLMQPSLGQSISLVGCAVKTSLNEKTKLAILSNNAPAQGIDKMAGSYLSHWPNLEESFQDFSRKIELSTYTGDAQKFASLLDSSNKNENAGEMEEIFAGYVKMLDAYLRWYFLPSGYQQKNLDFTRENFYGLSTVIVVGKDRACVKVKAQPGYSYLEDLGYLVRRFNERHIDFGAGKLFYLENIAVA